ncbi:MAG: hypothetical protein MJZ93_04675 [Paludibacteraceae bacterium]|nr:hypothetical protein [Paludibacteraceae bacterium]
MLKKLPTIVLIAIGALSLVVIAMFLGGLGDTTFISPNSGDELQDSTHTDLFLNWTYILFGVALLIFAVSFVLWIIDIFAKDRTRGFVLVGSLIALAVIGLISWSLGSAEELKIIGYEGSDNVGFWCQWTDMMLYMSYTLVAVIVVSVLATVIFRAVKK